MMNITIPNLYDSDYQLWLESTINQLRQGDFQAVDWPVSYTHLTLPTNREV